MEYYLLIPLYSGFLILVCAWVWLLTRAFQAGVWWGLASVFLPPLALWFALRHAQRANAPLVMLLVGGICITGPALYLLAVPPAAPILKTMGNESQLWSVTSGALRSDVVHEWVESRAYFLQIGAIPVIACAWIWLLVRAFRARPAWGWGSFFMPPVGLLFAARHPRRGAAPVILLITAILVAAVPAVYILCVRLDLGPRDKNVNGERHVTLTGWDRDDYSILRLMPDISVLQMANPDVTDQALESLNGMRNLQELDLNGTQVSDAGLAIIRDLPVLATLRLAKTKVTDKGFRELLSPKNSLMQLDLRNTQISPDTVKNWRAANPKRKAMR